MIQQPIHVLPTTRSVIVNFAETKEETGEGGGQSANYWIQKGVRWGWMSRGCGAKEKSYRYKTSAGRGPGASVAFSIAIGNKCRTTSAVYCHAGRGMNVSTLLLQAIKNFIGDFSFVFSVDLSSFLWRHLVFGETDDGVKIEQNGRTGCFGNWKSNGIFVDC